MVTIYNAKKWFGQKVNVKDRDYDCYSGKLIGFANPEVIGGVSQTVPRFEYEYPYRVEVEYVQRLSKGETFVRTFTITVKDFVPACPDCGSDYDTDHGYCPVCYCGHLVCVD